MRLIIQIPCLNERDQLASTLADLPRSLPGVACIEVLIIDDGSTDGTADLAKELGVHHVVRFAKNRGLAAAHMAGLDAAMRLGADIVVNTDADNQYRGTDIAALVEPITAGRADLTIGDRQTATIAEFSPLKRWLQQLGSAMVRRASGTAVRDSTSGFRAMNRKALGQLFVHNRFSYTVETIIQAGNLGLVIEDVTITTNPKTRESRLFRSIPEYLRRNGTVIFRAYTMYWPVQTFGAIAVLLFLFGFGLGLRFLYFYVQEPNVSGHIQSLQVAVGSVVLSFIVGLMAVLGELLATNRRLSEELLARVRRLDALVGAGVGATVNQGSVRATQVQIEGVDSTGAAPWRADELAPQGTVQSRGDAPVPRERMDHDGAISSAKTGPSDGAHAEVHTA